MQSNENRKEILLFLPLFISFQLKRESALKSVYTTNKMIKKNFFADELIFISFSLKTLDLKLTHFNTYIILN